MAKDVKQEQIPGTESDVTADARHLRMLEQDVDSAVFHVSEAKQELRRAQAAEQRARLAAARFRASL